MLSIICISLVLVFIILHSYYKKQSRIEYVTRNDILLENNPIKPLLLEYLVKIRSSEIKFKTGRSDIPKDDLLDFYIDHIQNFKKDERDIIKKYIYLVQKYCDKFPKIKDSYWRFIKLSPNLDKGMPFTLGDYIFISSDFIKKLKKSINNSDNIKHCDTIIHEQIHIIQRNYPTIFNKFYKSLGIKRASRIVLTNYWKNRHLQNPDGMNINWIYKNEGLYYLPLLTHNNGQLEQVVIRLNQIGKDAYKTTTDYKNIYRFPFFKDLANDISPYHPNELSAYIIPKLILYPQKYRVRFYRKFIQFLEFL